MLKTEYKFETNKWMEERTTLVVTHNGKIIYEFCDGGEPEDNSFNRDWNWVAGKVEEAYELGLEDRNKLLTLLLNKVNKVTAPHRHGNKVSEGALDELSNRQIDIEEKMKKGV